MSYRQTSTRSPPHTLDTLPNNGDNQSRSLSLYLRENYLINLSINKWIQWRAKWFLKSWLYRQMHKKLLQLPVKPELMTLLCQDSITARSAPHQSSQDLIPAPGHTAPLHQRQCPQSSTILHPQWPAHGHEQCWSSLDHGQWPVSAPALVPVSNVPAELPPLMSQWSAPLSARVCLLNLSSSVKNIRRGRFVSTWDWLSHSHVKCSVSKYI